jgi:hypothetical protein
LTIEAFQIRMAGNNQLTYFKNVSSKVALRINHESFRDDHRSYMAHCCNTLGCEVKKKKCRAVSHVAAQIHGLLQDEDATREVPSPLLIFHYARSLEKFELQYSVNKASYSDLPVAKDQNVGLFMDLSLGM